MKTPDIRISPKPFMDRAKFPYGFRKSGDFSICEADLLSRYGTTLLALEKQELSPQSQDEKQFVDFVQGKAAAQTTLEKAWQKYVQLARGKRNFYTLHSSASNQADYDDDYVSEEYDVAG
ncbi:DUF413 domain-containing protein [Salinimonas chungwhensis]|uniref:DUF413 domain-containing protein n=1 Tax=Salinimonas chungwhensis TaxID=265425 RepID=UPI0003650689|nr:DUF413 domain-containing protein [Salinimonas chungwhensis]